MPSIKFPCIGEQTNRPRRRQNSLYPLFLFIGWVLLTGCQQEPAEEPVYQLLMATMEEGSAGVRQRNSVDLMRFRYAINA